jgi:hypothetical protein
MKTNKTRTTIIAAMAAALILTATANTYSKDSCGDFKRVLLGESGASVAVPAAWEAAPVDTGSGMAVHLLVQPSGKAQGHFTVHLLDRGGADMKAWTAFHREKNLPAAHGECAIDAESWCAAGSHKAWRLHVSDIPARQGYGLQEALVFTEARVVFLSYLYDRACAAEAGYLMERIVASFSASPDHAAEARTWYAEGCNLGLESVGLFLKLPRNWMPRGKRSGSSHVVVDLPSGGLLHAVACKHVSGGMKGLARSIRRSVRGWTPCNSAEPVAIGSDGAKAQWHDGAGDFGLHAAVVALNGKGGFGLIMTDAGADDLELLKKIAAKAVLMDPREADAARRHAMDRFKEALRTDDPAGAGEALAVLELFSGRDSVSALVARGLDAGEEIQVRCAAALGRLGSRTASRALEKTLADNAAPDPLKRTCIEALCLITGPRKPESAPGAAN